MPKRNINLTIDIDTYAKYKAQCNKEGHIISRRVEEFMKKELQIGTKK